MIGGETAAGARLAGRIGDGWSAFDVNFEANLPLYLEALEAAGRRREDQRVIVGFQGDWLSDESVADSPWVVAPRDTWAPLAGGRCRWRHRAGPGHGRRGRPGRGGRALVMKAEPGARPAKPALTHPCQRCGAPVPLDVGLCERCNPLGLRDSSSSQVHGIAIAGVIAFVIFLAIVGRLVLSGVGPFDASVAGVVTDGRASPSR